MANVEQLAILRQGVEAWNAWRQEYPHNEINFRGVDLREADLKGANLWRADLWRADLTDADLTDADLWRANLTEANLHGANLWRADLQRADLTDADLWMANLTDANFWRANLWRANLTEANLHGANLTEANLTGADLQRADLTRANMQALMIDGTVFVDVDFRGVHGLDTVQHRGPSSIGIDTLYRSQGDIPDVFLRGCGVPDPMIEYARSLVLAVRPIDYYSCFISYSHADTSFARRLHDALQGRGVRCWLDEHQLLPGHLIYDEIDRGIRLWDKILLCASEHSLASWWVDNEIDKAFEKEQQFTKQRGTKIRALIPLNLDNALWHWQDGKANQVRSRLAADFTGWEQDNAKFEREFERLVKALRRDEGREEPPTPKL